jgi:uncharacterized protein (TIGR02996 family)
MVTDETFLEAIRAAPRDDFAYCIYADWLEERGDPLAAVYRRPRLTNAIGLELVLIPPGTFLMGSPKDEEGRTDDEGPVHEVAITRPFYLGVHPVTQEQYQHIMGNNPSWFCPTGDGKNEVAGLDTRLFPVERVSWEDAVAFCEKLTALAEETRWGWVYRLPSEAEWEYACRGGSPSYQVFHLGRPCKVGSYAPNAFGLYDMHGNVWEWCQDWYGADYYAKSPQEDPPGPPGGLHRVVRGGDFGANGRFCRSAYRGWREPARRPFNLGFRVVLVSSAP